MASDRCALLFVNKQLNDCYSWHCNYYCDHCGPSSSKKIMLDAQIYVSSSNCESPLGTLSYFNSSNMVFRKDDVACNSEFAFSLHFSGVEMFLSQIAKMEDDAQIHPLPDSKEKYDFVGDIQWVSHLPLFNALLNIISDPQIVPLTPPSSDCDDNTSFSIDPTQNAYLHILGAAVNCDEKEATFKVEIDQYISTLKDVKSSQSKFVTTFSCSIPDSPRYKTGKPVPYNR